MPGYSDRSHSNRNGSRADGLKRDPENGTLEIPLSRYLSKAGQTDCATDFAKQMSKVWPGSEVTLSPDGKLSMHIPGAKIYLKDYNALPPTVEGPIGALRVYDKPNKDSIDLTFANARGGPDGFRKGAHQTDITGYVNTDVFPVGRKPNQMLGFAPTEGSLADKITAEGGNVSQTTDKDHSYVASSFVPWSHPSGSPGGKGQ